MSRMGCVFYFTYRYFVCHKNSIYFYDIPSTINPEK